MLDAFPHAYAAWDPGCAPLRADSRKDFTGAFAKLLYASVYLNTPVSFANKGKAKFVGRWHGHHSKKQRGAEQRSKGQQDPMLQASDTTPGAAGITPGAAEAGPSASGVGVGVAGTVGAALTSATETARVEVNRPVVFSKAYMQMQNAVRQLLLAKAEIESVDQEICKRIEDGDSAAVLAVANNRVSELEQQLVQEMDRVAELRAEVAEGRTQVGELRSMLSSRDEAVTALTDRNKRLEEVASGHREELQNVMRELSRSTANGKPVDKSWIQPLKQRLMASPTAQNLAQVIAAITRQEEKLVKREQDFLKNVKHLNR